MQTASDVIYEKAYKKGKAEGYKAGVKDGYAKAVADFEEEYRVDANAVIDKCIQAIEESKSLFDNTTKWTMAEKDKIQNMLRNLKEQNTEQHTEQHGHLTNQCRRFIL